MAYKPEFPEGSMVQHGTYSRGQLPREEAIREDEELFQSNFLCLDLEDKVCLMGEGMIRI